jgi:hypothetical protein
VTINHPPASPDLNPIKNVWAWLKNKLYSLPRCPTTAQELFEEARKIWHAIAQSYIVALVDSMLKRMEAVKAASGGPTKY